VSVGAAATGTRASSGAPAPAAAPWADRETAARWADNERIAMAVESSARTRKRSSVDCSAPASEVRTIWTRDRECRRFPRIEVRDPFA
jgi:hypothetical protein